LSSFNYFVNLLFKKIQVSRKSSGAQRANTYGFYVVQITNI